MKERPILFSTPMIKANLEDRKTMTRRVVQSVDGALILHDSGKYLWSIKQSRWIECPYGIPGDRLWVRETWAADRCYNHLSPMKIPKSARLYYNVSHVLGGTIVTNWHKSRPSIHMPRWVSRITLEITKVKIERLQDISEEDAAAEGIERVGDRWKGYMKVHGEDYNPAMAKTSFSQLWESINGKRQGCTWADNPWVWVVAYRRIKP